MTPVIDDQTAQYILVVQKHFEDLKQVAAQLAGYLVLEAAGSKEAVPDHPMLGSARQLYQTAADGVQSVRATPRAQAHHQHLLAAVEKLGMALHASDPLPPLRAAWTELRAASHSLPGFEIVSFEQCCCHSGKRAA